MRIFLLTLIFVCSVFVGYFTIQMRPVVDPCYYEYSHNILDMWLEKKVSGILHQKDLNSDIGFSTDITYNPLIIQLHEILSWSENPLEVNMSAFDFFSWIKSNGSLDLHEEDKYCVQIYNNLDTFLLEKEILERGIDRMFTEKLLLQNLKYLMQ